MNTANYSMYKQDVPKEIYEYCQLLNVYQVYRPEILVKA